MHKPRKWITAFLLSLFLGYLGADRYYIGRYTSAVLKMITLGALGIWWLSDIILIAAEWRKDAWGRPLVH